MILRPSAITICYGKYRKWESRAEAIDYFTKGALECDGAERKRYTNILSDLYMNRTIAWDGVETPDEFKEVV